MTITITRLYQLLVEKTDKETAETLTTYIDGKINKDIENKVTTLATKEDIASLRSGTKEDIASLRSETKEAIASLRSETKEAIANLRSETKKDIASLRSETKEAIANVHTEIANVRTEIAKAKTEMIRWYVTLFVMLTLMIAGLYLKK